jgi:hypothetical protein
MIHDIEMTQDTVMIPHADMIHDTAMMHDTAMIPHTELNDR